MSVRTWCLLAVFLGIVIVALAVALFAIPAPKVSAPTLPQATSTNESTLPTPSTSATSSSALDTQVTVTSPLSGATVAHTFDVAGTAPGGWFFEAVFPIQVRDGNDDLIGTSQGRAHGDWMQPGLVTFTSQVTVDASYKGPANLILLKDNPSGNPETADEVTVPIIIK